MFVSKYFSWSRGVAAVLCSSRLPLRGGTLGGGTAALVTAGGWLAITGGGRKATAAALGERGFSLALEPIVAAVFRSRGDSGKCFPEAEFSSGFWKG